LVTAGQQAQGFGITEPNLYAELPPIARPLVKWAAEVHSLAELPLLLHRAAKTALAPPTGPVFLSLPVDVMNAEGEAELGAPTRVAPFIGADPAAIEAAAALLAGAERPMIVAGDLVAASGAHEPLARLAELIGAPVYLEGEASTLPFPPQHPLFRSPLVRLAPGIREVLAAHDVLFSAGGDLFTLSLPPEVPPVPAGLRIVHLDNDPWQLGKNSPAAAAILADPRTALPELLRAIEARMTSAQRERAAARGRDMAAAIAAERKALQTRARREADRSPISPLALMQTVGALLPPEAVIVEEAISSGAGLFQFLQSSGPGSLFGLRGGGIGWGLPAAIGVAMALPERPAVALVGDGSAMYSCQALWTAAHERVPVTFVILNNRSYRILKQRLNAARGAAAQRDRYIGMELSDPAIDFSALAGSLGVPAIAADNLPAFADALREGLAADHPLLIDAAVDPSFKPL
jgi:benzoylformate decarboxylase